MMLKILKPTTAAERETQTVLDTVLITPAIVKQWKIPDFQRPLIVNEKVRAAARKIAEDGGVVPDVITLGVLESVIYLVDGQHRKEAFLLSDMAEGYADIRTIHFESMQEMSDAFVRLNSTLRNMGPNDILRGLESSRNGLAIIRTACPWVGYDRVRLNESSPLLSMSVVLRCWFSSQPEVPNAASVSAQRLADRITVDEAETLTVFLQSAMRAWGRDIEYQKLWLTLNLTLCAWLYRRIVLNSYSAKTRRLTVDQFTKALMGLSADAEYVDWLTGRKMGINDRAPAYGRIRAIMVKRLEQETGHRYMFPAPAWAAGFKSYGR